MTKKKKKEIITVQNCVHNANEDRKTEFAARHGAQIARQQERQAEMFIQRQVRPNY